MTAKIYHAELWGVRESKYSWLQANDINTTKWKTVNPQSEFYLFIPRNESLSAIYEQYWKVTDIFPVNCLGIQTHRDAFVTDFNYADLRRKIMMFRNLSLPDEIIQDTFKLRNEINGKSIYEVRKKISSDEAWNSYFNKILYRPFDIRDIYFSHLVVDRPRLEVMSNITHSNLALLSPRRANEWHHAFVSQDLTVDVAISSASREANYIFPLYLYPSTEKKGLLSHVEGEEKAVNISPKTMEALTAAYKKTPSPEEIFHYIYAVLYSGTYRTKYAEFLKIDFPRVPFTKDYKLFRKMAEYGKGLVELHLLKSVDLDSPIARFQGKGDNRVEKPKYEGNSSSAVILAEPVPACRGSRESFLKKDAGQAGMTKKIKGGVTGCVYINKEQYFEGILSEVWNYQIGGYQVCDKWLKDRKGRILSLEEIQSYCRIVTAIQKTIEIQKTIDEIYNEIENNLSI